MRVPRPSQGEARGTPRRQPPPPPGSRLRRGQGRREIDATIAAEALELLEIDAAGLDRHDRQFLDLIASKFGGGPVGLSTLSVALGEEATLEDVFEPYLPARLIKRTPRGGC